jgi:hypothetical protein
MMTTVVATRQRLSKAALRLVLPARPLGPLRDRRPVRPGAHPQARHPAMKTTTTVGAGAAAAATASTVGSRATALSIAKIQSVFQGG